MEQEILKALSVCPVFHEISMSDIEEILSGANYRIIEYAAKDVYILSGMPCQYADFIVEGEMIARMVGLSGKLVQIDRLRKGTLVAPAFIFAKNNLMPVSV